MIKLVAALTILQAKGAILMVKHSDLSGVMRAGVLAVSLMALPSAVPASAQNSNNTNTTTTTRTEARDERRDDRREEEDRDWGWLGLLGLAGLLGLMPRKRTAVAHETVAARDRAPDADANRR